MFKSEAHPGLEQFQGSLAHVGAVHDERVCHNPWLVVGLGADGQKLAGCLREALGFLEQNAGAAYVAHVERGVYPWRGLLCLLQLGSQPSSCNKRFGYRRLNRMQLAGFWLRLPHLVGEGSGAAPNVAPLSRW